MYGDVWRCREMYGDVARCSEGAHLLEVAAQLHRGLEQRDALAALLVAPRVV